MQALKTLDVLFAFSTTPVVLPTAEEELQSTLCSEEIAMALKQNPTAMLPWDDTEDNAEIRRARCGSIGYKLNPVTGNFYKARYTCGQWRDDDPCPICLQDRVNSITGRLHDALDETEQLVAIILSPAQATKFVRRLRDRNLLYLRYPGDPDDTIIFDYTDAEDLASVEELIFVDNANFDFGALVLTPERRRISGKLAPEFKDDTEYVSIQFDQVYAEPGDQSLDACVDQAVAETEHLDPRTIDELQFAVDIRIQVFKDVILRTGGRIVHTQMSWARVPIDAHIAWDTS